MFVDGLNELLDVLFVLLVLFLEALQLLLGDLKSALERFASAVAVGAIEQRLL